MSVLDQYSPEKIAAARVIVNTIEPSAYRAALMMEVIGRRHWEVEEALLEETYKWDRFIAPGLFISTYFKRWGYHIDLHKMVSMDRPECFHTHPATAVRIILAGGYIEQVLHANERDSSYRVWQPGMIGIVRPAHCHRIHALLNDRYSYSLWLRGPVVAEIQLKGWGWRDEDRPHPSAGKN